MFLSLTAVAFDGPVRTLRRHDPGHSGAGRPRTPRSSRRPLEGRSGKGRWYPSKKIRAPRKVLGLAEPDPQAYGLMSLLEREIRSGPCAETLALVVTTVPARTGC